MFKKIFHTSFVSLFALTNVYAAVNSVPDDLMHAGKPIDSLCFFNGEKAEGTVDLRNCGAAKKHYTVVDANQSLSSKGYIGYNWKDTAAPVQGSTYYRFFPAGNHTYWIETLNNEGGSGDFTAIYLVHRKDEHTLTLKKAADGDRCNGGIEEVSEKNKALYFSVNLTAYDVIHLGKKHPSTLKAYDDLAACAVCCTAKAFYSVSYHSKTPVLNYVNLNHFSSVSEMPDQGKYQACFNKLAFTFINKNEIRFDQEKLNQFIGKFYQACVS